MAKAILAALGLTACFLAAPARAQGSCSPTSDLLAALAAEHDERPRFAGVDAAGNAVALTVSPAGTWTLVVTPPGLGLSCIVAHGQAGRILVGDGASGRLGI